MKNYENPIICASPIGDLKLWFDGDALVALMFTDEAYKGGMSSPPDPKAVEKCLSELKEYFDKQRKTFTVKLRLDGTPFRQGVWQALLTIPYGETRSYRQLAEMVENPRAVRAVGGANHHNPVSIIVPCHRVIGADGSLTGYGGGIEIKEWLLKHERDLTA